MEENILETVYVHTAITFVARISPDDFPNLPTHKVTIYLSEQSKATSKKKKEKRRSSSSPHSLSQSPHFPNPVITQDPHGEAHKHKKIPTAALDSGGRSGARGSGSAGPTTPLPPP